MNLTTWSPFRDLDTLFDRFTRDSLFPRAAEGDVQWRPAASIVENKKEFTIKADLPAVERADIDISVENGVLTIKGERRYEKSADDEKEHRRESFYGLFSRSFALPENVDESKISAESKNGVLIVHLPKSAPEKPKSLSIKVD
jgi:HSP20 family protein